MAGGIKRANGIHLALLHASMYNARHAVAHVFDIPGVCMADPQLVNFLLLGAVLVALLVIIVLLVLRGQRSRELDAQITRLQTGLAELQIHSQANQTETRALVTSLTQVHSGLAELRAYVRARHDVERQTMDSIRRLETVIAGTQTKGSAGENIVEAVFAKLPPEWQLRDFTIDNKTVEFGLRLPNQLVLPIDSKWAATNLLEAFVDADSLREQQRLKKQIERAVLHKAREVRKYLHPSLTTPFGVAVVPDAVYDLCAGIQAEVFSLNIVLISYSLFTPYLLMVFQTVLKSGQSVDLHKLEAYLNSVEENLDALQGELEGRYSRALRMLTNAGNEMRTQLSQLRGGLSGIQVSARTVTLAEDTRPDGLPEAPSWTGDGRSSD